MNKLALHSGTDLSQAGKGYPLIHAERLFAMNYNGRGAGPPAKENTRAERRIRWEVELVTLCALFLMCARRRRIMRHAVNV